MLLGPSGAGKTTTLRVIAGLEKPDVGTVHLNGIDATEATPAERDLAMVFQSYALYPKQTAAREHRVAAAGAQAAEVRDRRAGQAGRRSCCTSSSCSTASPAQMSGGEMQRVALGRALVRDPRAFLMDEPLTNLDLKLRVEMRTELTRIHRSLGRTFLYVTNDQVEAMSMADQVAVLREGTVQQVGSPTEIYDHPANRWVATFVGSPRMNLLDVHGQRPARGRRLVSCPNPGFGVDGDRPALLGVRSEDLSLDVRDESRGAGRQGLRRRAAGRPHARRHRDRRAADRRQGAADGVATRSASRSARRSTSTASTCSTPTRRRRSRRR